MTNEEFDSFVRDGLDINYHEDIPRVRFPVQSLEQTCGACPSQWEGKTAAGQDIYVRYRYGSLRLDIDEHTVMTWTRPDSQIGDNAYDGCLSHIHMRALTSMFLDHTAL